MSRSCELAVWSWIAGSLMAASGCSTPLARSEGFRAERLPCGDVLVTFHVRDVDGGALARQIDDAAGVRVVTEPLGKRVSLCVEDVPWRIALERVAGEILCRVSEAGGGGFRLEEVACHPPLAFEDADIHLVFELFGRALGCRFELPASLRGSVTGVYSLSSREDERKAIDAIASSQGLRLKWPDPCSDEPIAVDRDP